MNESETQGPSEYTRKLFDLFETLRERGHTVPKHFGCLADDLEIFEAHYKVDLPETLREFLMLTLPVGDLDIGVYKTCSPRDLLDEQLAAVPFYPNIPNHLFGFGWWSGEGDGDGWVFDLVEKKIHAVSHGNAYDHTRESFLASESYLQFDGFDEWVDYLVKRCNEYGWLDNLS